MPCYSPLHGFKGPVNANGKRPVVWKAPAGSERQDVPCGKCIGCRLEYSRNMACRCMLEADCHTDNCFVTVTYDDERLPDGFDGNLSVEEHQLFVKRLRHHFKDRKFKFYMCGEYGSQFGRPHYHYLLFGVDFADKVLETVRNGKRLYRSQSLESLWPYGFSSVGSVDYQSAAYVARYCLKKVGTSVERFVDESDGKRYQVDVASGEVKRAEFTLMSRGGRNGTGVGSDWFARYRGDVFPSDQLVVNGKVSKPPRYFLNLLEKADPQMFDDVKARRLEFEGDWNERSDLRLAVKEKVKLAQIKSLKRSL